MSLCPKETVCVGGYAEEERDTVVMCRSLVPPAEKLVSYVRASENVIVKVMTSSFIQLMCHFS